MSVYRDEKMVKGEITVFLSLVFLLLLTLVGALLESASIQLAKNERRADAGRAVESAFAEYQKDLLEYFDNVYPEIGKEIETTKQLSDELVEKIVKAAEEFRDKSR